METTHTEHHIMITIEPINVKRNIFKRFPWFLFSWTIVLVFVFVYVDNSNYAYGCRNDIFQWRLMTYHMFHANISHIIINVFAFWLFGLYIHMVYNDVVNMIIYIIGVILSGFAFYIDCDLQQSNNKVTTKLLGLVVVFVELWVLYL